MKLPYRLQPVLWSTNIKNLDTEKDKYYIIHQILSFGTLDDILWLLTNYAKKTIIKIFQQPFKNYRRSRFYFIKDALLRVKNWHPDERRYVKNIPRATR